MLKDKPGRAEHSLPLASIPCPCFPSLALFSIPQLGIFWSTCTTHIPGQPSQLWSGGSQRDI